jgi:hypothetical protein
MAFGPMQVAACETKGTIEPLRRALHTQPAVLESMVRIL